MIRNKGYAIEPVTGPRAPKNHPKNARRGDLEAIEASIAANGFWGAIVVQDATDLIVIGNHRFRAAVARRMPEIPVIRVDCTDAEAERMAVADNRTSDLAGYDLDAQVAQLTRIAEQGGGLAGTGFSADQFAALENELAAIAKQAERDARQASREAAKGGASEDDKADDISGLGSLEEPITKKGDLWLLGEHRLLCGNSFNAADRKRVFESEVVDLIVMDPPYAIYGSSTGIGADIADDLMVRPFFTELFKIAHAHVKEFAHVYTCCDWRSWAAIWESAKDANLSAKNCIVWDKGSSGLGSNYANTYEMIGYFAKLPPATAMKSTTRRGQRTVHAPNVARHNRVSGAEREHNAAKPVALFEWLIGNSSDPGDLVADFFLGSGTTIIAAERTKRRCYGFEVKEKYCDVIVARWERETGKRAKRVPVEEVQQAEAKLAKSRKEKASAEPEGNDGPAP